MIGYASNTLILSSDIRKRTDLPSTTSDIFSCVLVVCRWGKRAAHNRAQITYYMAENLELRRDEFGNRISQMTGCSLAEGLREVDLSIERLYYWSAYADKFGGTVQVWGKTISF